MSKQEEAEPSKKEIEKTASVGEERNEEDYDPYSHRTGHISTSIAFFHLVKSSIGSGILSMPFGFKTAGMIGGFILGVVVAAFVIFCFLVMINTMVKVAKELKVPHVTLQEAATYVMEHSCEAMARYAKTLQYTIDAMLILNYVGTCASYYNYIIICTLTISGYKQYAEGAVNLHRAAVAGMWFFPLFAVNCVRGLRKMGPISIIGNVLILGSMMVVLYFIFSPHGKGFSDTWTYFASYETTPLFVGIMIFSIGSIGVGIAIERDMKDARKFGGGLAYSTFP
uniref:Amino acid transporter transmembrane domain-containing protein n=1 Tax=Lygus hesperus TaxID=30085 RepID=A0A0K8TCV5_LYGHE